MKNYIEQRVIELANYIIDNRATVRSTAKHFNISKSTVHKDLTQRLEKVKCNLYQQVRDVLDENKNTRHIRGGIATKEKYKRLHEQQG